MPRLKHRGDSNVVEVPFTATGCAALYVPPGAKCEEILLLIRLGQRFRSQQVGKRPGTLSLLVLDCARRAGPPYSFDGLLCQLELLAVQREQEGERASPVEKVSRVWQLLTFHHPRTGRMQIPFSTLRNHLTNAKKILRTCR